MEYLRATAQEAAQKVTQKVIQKLTMEAQNLEERIERVGISTSDTVVQDPNMPQIQLNLPITLTKDQEEKLQGMVSAIKNAIYGLKEVCIFSTYVWIKSSSTTAT